MTTDVVWGFVGRYHSSLEIAPDLDLYRIADLDSSFGPVLSRTPAAVASRTRSISYGVPVVDLDLGIQFTDQCLMQENAEPPRRNFLMSSKGVPIRLAFSSFAFYGDSRGLRCHRNHDHA